MSKKNETATVAATVKVTAAVLAAKLGITAVAAYSLLKQWAKQGIARRTGTELPENGRGRPNVIWTVPSKIEIQLC